MLRRLQLAVVVVSFSATAIAQADAGKRVCTDLSGKVRVECPSATPNSMPDGSDASPAASETPVSAGANPAETVKKSGSLVPAAAHPAKSDDTAAAPPILARSEAPARHYSSIEASLPRNFVADQKNFWTSPLRLRVQDATWLLPVASAFAITTIADSDIEKKLPNGATFIRHSKSFSNYGAAAYAGLVGGAYLWGRATHNDHLRETAVLSGEAALNTLLIAEGAKYIAGRSRPYEGNGAGDFRTGGSSFPSLHAADAFAIATVVAHEYPGPLTKLLAYGGAAAIGAARVTGRQHFASDVLVGGALGWFVGRQVFNAHSDEEIREMYGTFKRAPRERGPRDPAFMGSPYVPLDSWIYPAIDRLAAMGYIDTAFEGMRPWTRMECAKLVQEAEEKARIGGAIDDIADQLVDELSGEFAVEKGRVGGARNLGGSVDSVYARLTAISGPVLTDGYHFGQTIINDDGRPYEKGFNAVTGFTAHAEAGPLAFFVRGEYQHAPPGGVLPDSARQLIGAVDFLPSEPPAVAAAAINRFRVLDAYVAANLDDWQISVGKQSIWWGPGDGGPMLLSNNAEPIDMIRVSRVSPRELPSVFHFLGPARMEFFFGQLSGQEFLFSPSGLAGQFTRSLEPQPYIHGQKISFRPTPNLEFGFSRTTIYGGPGFPMTFGNLGRTLFSTRNTFAGDVRKPGDRRSGFDFSYRVPGLRNWLTVYADGFNEDQFSPVAYADRAVWRTGMYVPHVPFLRRLELRAEGVYSDNPIGGAVGPGYYYFNATWRSGYTENGNLIGSWIGRAGQGAQAWATFHFSAKNFVEMEFRHQKISHDFLPRGGTITDFGIRGDLWANRTFAVSSKVQVEQWTMPVLAPGRQSDVATSIQFSWFPFAPKL